MTHQITRQQLYEMVWNEPLISLSKKYGISGVGLAKACRKAMIPVPPRGYWAKLEAGKPVRKIPLPDRGFGMSESVGFGHTASNPERSQYSRNVDVPTLPPAFPEEMTSVKERAEGLFKRMPFTATIAQPNQLIARLMAEDEKRREKQSKERYKSIFDGPFFDSPFEQRRLRILNGLLNGFERAGFKTRLHGKHALSGGVLVGDQWVHFNLDSPGSKDDQQGLYGPRKPPQAMDLALVVRSYGDKALTWQDEKGRRLEKRLREIAIELVVHGERKYRERAESHYRCLVQRKTEQELAKRKAEEERLRLEQQRKISEEKARIDRLLGEAAALRQAQDIRQYVASVRDLVSAELLQHPKSAMDEWAKQALEQADRIDPVKNGSFLRPFPNRGLFTAQSDADINKNEAEECIQD